MTASPTNVTEFTVSELSFALKRTVEENYEHVRVRGEISNFKGSAGSGHCYFRLKDDRACLEAVVWKTTLQRLRFKPQEGLEMVATGKLTTYPGRSNYQIVVEHLEPAGEGALMALLEERRRKLQAQGIFDQARKKPIPYLPRVIGVVTSPTGAVIRDILHRLRDRFPTHVLVWPVRVQGEGAAEEVAAAVRGFNAIPAGSATPRPDLLIVARGGGSIEDLWAFNEEIAVRAVAESAIPIVAAVGHETDWTLIDYAADLRAPTPTGAAEMAVPVRAELLAATRDLASRHDLAFRRGAEARRREVASVSKGLPRLADLLALPRQKLDHAGERLGRSLVAEVTAKRRALTTIAARHSPALLARSQAQRAERLRSTHARLAVGQAGSLRQAQRHMQQSAGRHSLSLVERIVARHCERYETASRVYQTLRDTASPEAILARGYALVTDRGGHTVRGPQDVATNDSVRIFLANGEIGAVVTEAGRGMTKPRRRVAAKPRPAAAGQDSLF